jgi:2-oxoglutarate dehydrogenase E2 component (dihydrolipoamide succinyltransferase)
MSTNVDIPPLGDSVSEAVLLRWLKNDGDYVKGDEPLCELETDKANVDIPAPAAGVLRRAKEAGETVQIGETIARIDEAPVPAAAAPVESKAEPAKTAESKPAESKPAQAPSAPALDEARPSVRRLSEESRVDLAAVAGTGPRGQIIKEDVLRHVESRGLGNGQDEEKEEVPPVERGTPGKPSAPSSSAQHTAPIPPAAHQGPTSYDANGLKRVPMSKLRKRVADRLVSAQQTAAILTTFNEVDLSAVLNLRAKYKERFSEVYGVSLGLMSFFARATVLALKEFPRINAEIDGEDIVYHQYVHLGIAVSTDRGLAVPVLRNAEQMSFARVESEIKRLAAATRDGKLGLAELSGGTFTITNGGVFGSLISTPILNPPQSGILGMHAIVKRPIAVGDKVEIRPMMYIALSYDHRLVDGKESVSFLVRLKEYLEDPARLMLEI